jgi:hypothetical protein
LATSYFMYWNGFAFFSFSASNFSNTLTQKLPSEFSAHFGQRTFVVFFTNYSSGHSVKQSQLEMLYVVVDIHCP